MTLEAIPDSNPNDARAEYGKKETEHFIQAAIKFLREWKN